MSDIFSESYMLQVLEPIVPEGETLLAAVHGVTLQVNRKKTSRFDVYVGLTGQYLLVAECEERRYLNEFYRIPDKRKTVAEETGTCFPLAEIQSCTVKNAIMGAVNCAITLQNGNFLHIQLPKRGGLGGGMLHHGEYRERIVERLRALPGAQG